MKNLTCLFIILLVVSPTLFYSQPNQNKKRIGFVFKIEGPYKIHRETFLNMTITGGNDSQKDEYYDAINFLKTDKVNPTEKLKQYYVNEMTWRGFDLVILNEDLVESNFPVLNPKKNKQFYLDMTSLKKKYNVDEVFIVQGKYGLEFEDLGDKRTNIFLNNFMVSSADNKITKKFTIQEIQNIKKKNLLNPPDYPNIVESMNKLLEEKILSEIIIELEELKK